MAAEGGRPAFRSLLSRCAQVGGAEGGCLRAAASKVSGGQGSLCPQPVRASPAVLVSGRLPSRGRRGETGRDVGGIGGMHQL